MTEQNTEEREPGVPDLGSIPFDTEGVLWKGNFSLAELERLGEESLVLERGLTGPALLRAGGRYLALGKVTEEKGKPYFTVTRILKPGEGEQLLKKRPFCSGKIELGKG